MKRTLLVLLLVVVCGYGAVWFAASSMQQRSGARAWPDHLGVLADSVKRYPDLDTNAAAAALTKLTPALGISTTPKDLAQPQTSNAWEAVKEPIGDYNRAQLERVGDPIDPPPAAIAAYLAQHAAEIDAVRDHVLRAGPIQWVTRYRRAHDAPLPNLLGQMSLTKLLAARALAKAASHDAAAWDDLHAIWVLDRELWQRPELISQLIALAGSRMVNGAAAKMPLPVPAWFGEVQRFDYRHQFAASYQAEAWMINESSLRYAQGWRHVLARPYSAACGADVTEQMRARTAEIVASNACDLKTVHPMSVASWNVIGKLATPNLDGAWQRLERFRAEREATDKILALRSGLIPSTATSCTDGAWTVAENAIAFKPDIAVAPPGVKYPLAYTR